MLPEHLSVDTESYYTWTYMGIEDYVSGPNRYLQDAIDDLKSGKERRNCNNAVRNAKSALHMKVDFLCRAFSGDDFFRKSLRNFPRKMDFLESIGIVRPRIIDKINNLRNKIEHEYQDATLEEAEDFIDIVLLFVEATKYLNSRFPSDIEFQPPVSFCKGYLRNIECKFDVGELVFNYTEEKGYAFNHLNMNSYTVKIREESYFKWLKYIIENNE